MNVFAFCLGVGVMEVGKIRCTYKFLHTSSQVGRPVYIKTFSRNVSLLLNDCLTDKKEYEMLKQMTNNKYR